MFGSAWRLHFLSSCKQIHADGTFKPRPLLFSQLYILFGFDNGFMIPCIYYLSTKRNEILYKKIFNHVVALCADMNLNFSPQRFTSDFELASIQAFKSIFPDVKIAACFFHYAQSIWRKVQELGLSRLFSSGEKEFNSDEHKRTDYWLFRAIGLALIPPLLIEATWVHLMDEYTPNEPTVWLHISTISWFQHMLKEEQFDLMQTYGMSSNQLLVIYLERTTTLRVIIDE